MGQSERIPVVPEVLAWARNTAGFSSPSLAAKRLSVSEATLNKWETGELQPTIKQLRAMTKLYKRPLAVLLLPRPPKDFSPLRDFRSLSKTEPIEGWSPELHREFKRALMQREVFLELAEIAPESVPKVVPLGLSDQMSAEKAGQILREVLALDNLSYVDWSSPRDALNACIAAVQSLGILVIHIQNVNLNEARGFSLTEWPYPVIALNGSDWPRSRLFTLLHEVCHLALNVGGLCDLHETSSLKRRAEDDIEHYCNQAAAVVLMPSDRLLTETLVLNRPPNHNWTLDELRLLSRDYGASSEAVLLRLIDLGRATWDTYWDRKPELEKAYVEARQHAREKQRESAGGPSFYVIKARNLGYSYVTSVLDAFRSRAISSLDVADYLDIRFDQLPKLENVVRR